MNEEYINFGDELVNKLDLLKAINDYKAYSSTQPWSASRRGAFDAAVESAINRGILGTRKYTNPDTGESVYYATFGGDPFDINTFDKNTRRGYMDAASFIGRLAESLPTKKSIEEKLKKEEEEKLAKLLKFDNFENSFKNYMKQYLGGQEFNIGSNNGKEDKWNYLDDVRDENGAVGIENRTKELSKRLKEYKSNLKVEDYNWKDTPYGSSEEFLKRLDKAITALDSPGFEDDHNAIELLGLPYNLWFNNRTGEIYGYNGETPVTYGQYYRELKLLQELKAKDDAAKAEAAKAEAARKNAYNNTLFFNRVTNSKMLGQNAQALKEKYKDSNTLLSALLGYSLKDIRTLSALELSEVQGAYRYLATQPIDNKLLRQLQQSSSGLYKNAAPNRFRKINGIDNLIWDSVAGQVIQINTRLQQLVILNLPTDLFNGVLTQQEKENEYFNNPDDGFTNADIRELSAIGLDLTAMFDPTRIYGTAAGIGASGLRTYNRATDADGLTLTDIGASALDLGLNAVQWLPGIGNVANGAKGILSLAKFAPRIGRLIARLGAAGGLVYGISGLPEVWNKIDFAHPIDTAKRLTVEDWRKLSALIAGIKGTRDLNVTNRATRKVLEQNDILTSNRWSNKIGLTRTKIESEISTPTVRMKVGDKEVNIPIELDTKINLSKKLNKKGNNLEEKSRVAREDVKLLKAAEKAGIKVKDENGNLTKEWNEAVITYDPSWRDKTFFGRLIPGLAKNSGTFGTSSSSTSNIGNPLRFLEYLNNRGLLDKVWYGSNTTLRRLDNNLHKNGIYGNGSKLTEQLSETPKTEGSKVNKERMNLLREKFGRNKPELSNPKQEYNQKQQYKAEKEIELFEKSYGKHNNSSENSFSNGYGSNTNVVKNGEINVDLGNGIKFNFKVNNASDYKGNTGKVADLREEVSRRINEQLQNKDINRVKIGNLLRELKRKGWLKRGGTLTLDETINNFLKNNNI